MRPRLARGAALLAALLSALPVGAAPRAWVTNQGSHDVTVLSLAPETPLDARATLATVPVGRSPAGVVAVAARGEVVVSNADAPYLSVLSMDNPIEIARIDAPPGIVGLAVGFGAQTLVKDLIAGFFLTLENQVRVGDVAVINGTGGLVEEINLRTIVLRDGDGTVHIFPNGSIDKLANRTKDFSWAVVEVGVSYHEDPDRIIALLRELANGVRSDPKLGPSILEPAEVLGIEAFEEARMIIRARLKTLPLRQWDVARELRRRIVHAFAEQGIVVPIRPAAGAPAPTPPLSARPVVPPTASATESPTPSPIASPVAPTDDRGRR